MPQERQLVRSNQGAITVTKRVRAAHRPDGRRGHNVAEARKLLNNFYASQALFIQHRDQIQRELKL
jgi:hypothetical protein